MYAIVKTGGKQYRVEQGQSLLVERLSASEGDSVALDPLLYVDGSEVVDQVDGLSAVQVEARVVAHERGPKLRVVKFKPKRGYKRRTGHRQELTRLEVVGIKLGGGRGRSRSRAEKDEPAPVAAAAAPAPAEAPAAAEVETPAPKKPPVRRKPAAGEKPAVGEKPAAGEKAPVSKKPPAGEKSPARRKPTAKKTDSDSEEASDGT